MSDDVQKIITVGARAIYANYTITMVIIGIHVFMTLYGLSVFLETPAHLRKGRKRYITISFLITILSALTASLDMSWYFQILFSSTSPEDFSKTLDESWMHWSHTLSLAGVSFVIFIGDALLVYRCYVICVEYWWAAIFPGAMSLSALVILLVKICFDSNQDTRWATAANLLTVATNVFVTALITYRLLRARRILSELLPLQDMRRYTGVVAILIESAAPVSVFGIPTAILETAGRKATSNIEAYTVSYMTFSALFMAFCTLSPHMIIFRVTTGRSWTKFPTGPKESDDSGVLANPIQFAHQTAESSFLQSGLFPGATNIRSASVHAPNLTIEERSRESSDTQITGEKSGGAKLEV